VPFIFTDMWRVLSCSCGKTAGGKGCRGGGYMRHRPDGACSQTVMATSRCENGTAHESGGIDIRASRAADSEDGAACGRGR